MTKPVRNIMLIKRAPDKKSNSTSIILLSTSTERECSKWDKIQLSWEILKIQLHIIRKFSPNVDIVVVSNNNFNNISQIKHKYRIRTIPHLHQGNENEMQDIRFGLSSCLSQSAIIICGNILFSENILTGIVNGKSKILVDKNDSQLKSENIGVMIEGNTVVNLAYDIHPKWGKIIYLDEEDLAYFTDMSSQNGHTHELLFEGLNQLIGRRGAISSYSPRSGYFLKKSYTSGDIKRAKEYFRITENE